MVLDSKSEQYKCKSHKQVCMMRPGRGCALPSEKKNFPLKTAYFGALRVALVDSRGTNVHY